MSLSQNLENYMSFNKGIKNQPTENQPTENDYFIELLKKYLGYVNWIDKILKHVL